MKTHFSIYCVSTLATLLMAATGFAAVEKIKINFNLPEQPYAYLLLQVLDDEIIHGEYGVGAGPEVDAEIFSTPMVFKKDNSFTGPTEYIHEVNSSIYETRRFRLNLSTSSGCIEVFDKVKDQALTTICPWKLHYNYGKGISINSSRIQNAYGIAQYFNKNRVGDSSGDWFSHGYFETENGVGNNFAGFPSDSSGAWGANSQVQFPIMYALGERTSFGLFLDNLYKQRWEFNRPGQNQSDSWVNARIVNSDAFPMTDPTLRFYILGGDDPIAVRKNYMQLVGRPPVPPKNAFGLWVSEFGYDNWEEVEHTLYGEKNNRPGLREAGFPVDGFVLDLQWYGGVKRGDPSTRMGSLQFDSEAFPDAETKLQQFYDDGIEFVAIEQSYVGEERWAYGQLKKRGSLNDESFGGYLIHNCEFTHPISFSDWFGKVGMIDWSETGAGDWMHAFKRKPNLIDLGITGHWTDLGEPERFNGNSCYENSESNSNGFNLYRHADVHNIYNFLWNKSIFRGYQRDQIKKRPLLLARAGAPGIHRFGAAMWSGDITGRLEALANHWNAQMHMSFNGIDYYGSDVGGFWRHSVYGDRAVEEGHFVSENDLYTQWYAGSAWTDIPLRPHSYNCGFDPEFLSAPGCDSAGQDSWETSPAWAGGIIQVASQKFATHQRYELVPYYYSLAHEAYNSGEPVVAPPVMYFSNDPMLREMGHQKMIGKDILVGLVARHGQFKRKVYLPQGDWYNYHSGERVASAGEWTDEINLWSTGKFTLPVYVRSGAIIPTMHVDSKTKNVFGERTDGAVNNDLIVKVYGDREQTSFKLWEDDGRNVDRYDPLPRYKRRSIEITQKLTDEKMQILINPASGSFPGQVESRNNIVRGFYGVDQVSKVEVNEVELPRLTEASQFDLAHSGYRLLNGEIQIKTGQFNTSTMVKIGIFN